MKYEVDVLSKAVRDFDKAYRYAAKRAPIAAYRWAERLREAIRALSDGPLSWPLAREDRRVNRDIREKLFGRRPNVFRILFVVEAGRVRVLRIRRSSRRWLRKHELEE